MQTSTPSRQRICSVIALVLLCGGFIQSLSAQLLDASRIHDPVDAQRIITLPGTLSPNLASLRDTGPVSGNVMLPNVALHFRLTPEQQSDLAHLLRDQQTPGSTRYHQWLTPEQYASRYGLNRDDLAAVEFWLQSEGFSSLAVNASRTALSFSATTGQVEQVFGAKIHNYAKGGGSVLATSTNPYIPEALIGVVQTITGLDELRPAPLPLIRTTDPINFEWTSGLSTEHFMTPGDVASIYDLSALYAAGVTGKGQRIAIVGQSAIDPEDIARFRAAAGLTNRSPTLALVPGTGVAMQRSGDELESDVDLEYAGATAPDADVILVYTGSNASANVYDALAYAVDQDIAPIVSISYGECEQQLPRAELQHLQQVLMQANSQGQTILAASGDQGATACESAIALERGIAENGLAVEYPASSPYVTSVGGTMLTDQGSSWSSTNTLDGSAQGYIPEVTWNESAPSQTPAILGSGGGFSQVFSKPSWQVAEGLLSASFRAVPDISIDAGFHHDGYLLCSSDASSKINGSCSHGFLDATNSKPTVGGGTSFGSPILAGVFALASQMRGGARQGNLNPRLYALATAFPAMYHDIVTGDNREPCRQGSKGCPQGGTIGYGASPGYDPVTGLGTPDGYALVTALASSHAISSNPTTLDLSVQAAAEGIGASFAITAAVSSSEGMPTGSVQFSLDGQPTGAPVPTRNGQAFWTFSPHDGDPHTAGALFVSDSGFASSSARIQLESSAATQSAFTLSGSQTSSLPAAGAAVQITVTPNANYTGVVQFHLVAEDKQLMQYGCYAIADARVKGLNTAQTTLYLGRSPMQCSAIALHVSAPLQYFGRASAAVVRNVKSDSLLLSSLAVGSIYVPLGLMDSYCLLSCLKIARKRRVALRILLMIVVSVIGSTGCGTTATRGSASPGRYMLQVAASDTQQPAVASTTRFAITIE